MGYGLGLPVTGPHPVLPHLRDLGGELLWRTRRIEHDDLAGELVTTPGLLPLGILPSSNGNRLGHRVARALAMEILDRLTNPDPVQARRVRGVTFRQDRRHFLY